MVATSATSSDDSPGHAALQAGNFREARRQGSLALTPDRLVLALVLGSSVLFVLVALSLRA